MHKKSLEEELSTKKTPGVESPTPPPKLPSSTGTMRRGGAGRQPSAAAAPPGPVLVNIPTTPTPQPVTRPMPQVVRAPRSPVPKIKGPQK